MLSVKSALQTDQDYLRLVHELTGTLSVALLNLEQYANEGSRTSLNRLRANLRLIEDYLADARAHIKEESQDSLFSVDEILEELTSSFASLADALAVDIEYLPGTVDARLLGSPVKFKQLVSIVLRNALDAYQDRELDVRKIEIITVIQGTYLVVRVRDYGPGIKRSDQQQVFKPFYSTKPRGGSGLGIGLSLVKLSIDEDFGGKVELASRPKLGSVFKLYFKLTSH